MASTISILINAKDRASAAFSGVAQQAEGLGKKLDAAGGKMMAAGQKMTAFVTLPIVAGMAKAIHSASDLNETVSKTGVVFGDQAAEITKFADGAAKSLGLSKRAAMDAASTFGILGKQAGLSSGGVSKFGIEMTTLTSDLASFYNAKPEEAITAIGAAFRGESEPARRFGINLSVATIQARALSEGIVKAEVDTLKLSTAQEAVEKATRKHAEAIKAHGATSVQASDAARDMEQAESKLAIVMEGKVPILTNEQKLLATRAEILAQSSVANGDFARTSEGVANQERITAAMAENTAASFGQVLQPAYNAMMDVVQKVMGWFDKLTDSQKRWIVIAAGVAAAAGPVLTILGAIVTVVGALLSPIGLVIAALALLAAGAVYAYTHFEGFRRVVDEVVSWLRTNVPAGLTVVRNALTSAVASMKAAWDRWGDDIISTARSAWNLISPIVSGALNTIKGIISTILAVIRGDWSGAWNALKSTVSAAWSTIVAGVRAQVTLMLAAAKAVFDQLVAGAEQALPALLAFVKSIPGKIVAALGNVGSLLLDAGKQLMQGFVNGIKSMAGAAADAAKSAASGAVSGVKGLLGIHSPSRVFYEIGWNVGEGLANGIKAKTPAAIAAAKKMAEDAARAAQEAVSVITGAASAGRSLVSAQRGVGNAEEDLAVVRAKQATIGGRIAAAEAKLAKAREEATKVTASEQVAIDRARASLKKAEEQYNDGEISVSELTVAQEELQRALDASTADTQDVTQAESELARLRDEEAGLADELRTAEDRLRDARDQLTDAMLRGYEAGNKVNEGGSTMVGLFMQIAQAAGLSTQQIDALTAAINAIPTSKTVTITTVTQGPNYGGGTDNGDGTGGTGTAPGHGGAYATGGYFRARRGGYLGLIGEGRANEVLAPEPVLRDIVRQEAGGGGDTYVFQLNGTPNADQFIDALRRKGFIRPGGEVVISR
jgi:phage-related protein